MLYNDFTFYIYVIWFFFHISLCPLCKCWHVTIDSLSNLENILEKNIFHKLITSIKHVVLWITDNILNVNSSRLSRECTAYRTRVAWGWLGPGMASRGCSGRAERQHQWSTSPITDRQAWLMSLPFTQPTQRGANKNTTYRTATATSDRHDLSSAFYVNDPSRPLSSVVGVGRRYTEFPPSIELYGRQTVEKFIWYLYGYWRLYTFNPLTWIRIQPRSLPQLLLSAQFDIHLRIPLVCIHHL